MQSHFRPPGPPGPRPLRRRRVPFLLGAVAAVTVGSGACGSLGGAQAGTAAAERGTKATPPAARPPAAAPPTPGTDAAPEPFPWEPIDAIRVELGAALAQADWPALLARVPTTTSVMRYPSGAELQEVTADQLIVWLRPRWAPGLSVGEPRFVAHFPSLEVPTSGWRPVPPSGATILFIYHVNPDTRRWFLDVLQYE